MITSDDHPAIILKKATRAAHETTEALSYSSQILGGSLKLSQYYHLLSTHYVVHQVVMKAIDAHLPAGHELRHFLDLAAYQVIEQELPQLKQCSFSPLPSSLFSSSVTWTVGHSCGALYVLEGSRLGARIILKHLPKSKALSHLSQFHFYQQQTSVDRSRWKTFLGLLDKYLTSPKTIEEAVLAANQTFAAYRFYLEQAYSLIYTKSENNDKKNFPPSSNNSKLIK